MNILFSIKNIRNFVVKKTDFLVSLGKRIAELRLARKLSQDNLAEMCEVTTHAISLIETGNRFPRIDTLEKISNAFGVSVYDLFDFTQSDLNIEDMQNSITKMSEVIKNDKVKTVALYNFLKNLINM